MKFTIDDLFGKEKKQQQLFDYLSFLTNFMHRMYDITHKVVEQREQFQYSGDNNILLNHLIGSTNFPHDGFSDVIKSLQKQYKDHQALPSLQSHLLMLQRVGSDHVFKRTACSSEEQYQHFCHFITRQVRIPHLESLFLLGPYIPYRATPPQQLTLDASQCSNLSLSISPKSRQSNHTDAVFCTISSMGCDFTELFKQKTRLSDKPQTELSDKPQTELFDEQQTELSSKQQTRLSDQQQKELSSTQFTQLVTAISSLHAQGFAHRDIRSPNVVYNGDVPTIIDLEYVTSFEPQQQQLPLFNELKTIGTFQNFYLRY
jgi:hypothetical protein